MIDIKTIAQLRAQTGAGMMECQQALKEAAGDIDQAIEVLRKKGALKAAKKAERITKEGVVAIKIAEDHKKGSMVAVNCETDFVAKNQDFISFVNELLEKQFTNNNAEAGFNSQKEEQVLKIGENLIFGRADTLEGNYVAGYLHANKKVASLVVFNKEIPAELAHDIAMQIVADQPKYNQPENVPAEELAKEKEIYREQLKNEGKPEQVMDKIIEGKINKYYEDVCLLNQKFIKDDSQTIGQLLQTAGEDIQVVRFSRYQV